MCNPCWLKSLCKRWLEKKGCVHVLTKWLAWGCSPHQQILIVTGWRTSWRLLVETRTELKGWLCADPVGLSCVSLNKCWVHKQKVTGLLLLAFEDVSGLLRLVGVSGLQTRHSHFVRHNTAEAPPLFCAGFCCLTLDDFVHFSFKLLVFSFKNLYSIFL